MPSTAILFSDDAAFCATAVDMLAPHGWRTIVTTNPDDALAALTRDSALVLLDAGAVAAAAFLTRLRAEPQPVGGVPVLQHGGARLDGISALLPAAGDAAALIVAIETYTGGLDDHSLRDAPFSPFYRLVRLLGTRDAAAMIARFADMLRMALADAATSADQAHRLAGLAGAMGYTELGVVWRAAEQDPAATDAALAATHATVTAIEQHDLARYQT